MKKRIIFVCACLSAAASAWAGGLLTNTNQNAAFLRQMSQDAIIDITGMSFNPAGTAFLEKGLHLSLNVQSAKQSRNITTNFPLFQQNKEDRNSAHKFHGKALAPVLPSFQFSYNWDKWSLGANFSIGGGGGKCEFDEGLGSFEALYAGQITSNVVKTLTQTFAQQMMAQGVPAEMAMTKAMEMAKDAYQGYSMNSYLKGRQYYFGLQLGATRKITDNLSAYLGARLIYATCNYTGWVTDVYAYYKNPLTQEETTVDLNDSSIDMKCDQTGFGVTPVIGLDWKTGKWNFAAKYEAPTKIKLKNDSRMNEYAAKITDKTLPDGSENKEYNATLGQFADGESIREDIPAIIFAGAQFSPVEKLRINGGWHYYFDKQAKKYGDKQKQIDKNTMEFSAGAEFDACKFLTVSASWQGTYYRLADEYMNDLSFNISSNAIGLGVRLNVTPRCNIDLGYMQSLYHRRDVTTTTAAGPKQDHYFRKNRVFGLGVNLNL